MTGEPVVYRGELEASVGRELERRYGTPDVGIWAIECPQPLPARVGARTRGRLILDTGTAFGLTIEVTSLHRDVARVHVAVDETLESLSQAQVERQAARALRLLVGRPARVRFPGRLPAVTGFRLRGILTAGDGSTIGLTLVVTGIVEGRVQFELDVDQQPAPAPPPHDRLHQP